MKLWANNNITIDKQSPEEYWNGAIDIEVQQRGELGERWKGPFVKNGGHYPLNCDTIEIVIGEIEKIVSQRSLESLDHWTKMIAQPVGTGKSYRNIISEKGFYINPKLLVWLLGKQ